MNMKKYNIAFRVEMDLEIHEDVIERGLSQEFKDSFYEFNDENDVAEHIAYNIIGGSTLSMIDGFADMPNEYVNVKQISDYEVD